MSEDSAIDPAVEALRRKYKTEKARAAYRKGRIKRQATIRHKKFVNAVIADPTDLKTAAQKAGYKTTGSVQTLLKKPEIALAVEEGLSKAAIAAGVSRRYVLERLKENVERCMQKEPVLDNQGQPTGEWKFDSGGANRALELLGKHMKLFGDGDDSGVAKIGAAILRMLTMEAQTKRLREESTEATVVPTPTEPVEPRPAEADTQVPAP